MNNKEKYLIVLNEKGFTNNETTRICVEDYDELTYFYSPLDKLNKYSDIIDFLIIDKKSGLIISKEFTKERCIYMYKEGLKEIDNIRQEKWYSDIVKDYQEIANIIYLKEVKNNEKD